MIARSAAHQIKYYVLAVSEWFSHGLDPYRTFGAAENRSKTCARTGLASSTDACRGADRGKADNPLYGKITPLQVKRGGCSTQKKSRNRCSGKSADAGELFVLDLYKCRGDVAANTGMR
jgi:hypothetical protein